MKPALLLIDLQADYLSAAGLQPPAEHLIARAAALLGACRDRRVPVVHVWTTIHRQPDRRLPHWRRSGRWHCVAGTAGHDPPERLRPVAGEVVVHKTGFNGFADPELDAALRRAGCDTVVLAGLHVHACVRAVAVECLERNYEVLVAEDAAASNDPIHAAATRRWLAERCVRFEPAATILSRLDGGPPALLVHRSPRRTESILFEIPVSGANETASAIAAARDAWTKWRRTSLASRQSLLADVAGRLDAAAPDLARQMAVELGKPLGHGEEEVHRAAFNVRDVIRRAAAVDPQTREPAGLVRSQPLGVVAVITPWNNPVAIPIGKIVPALIYGNTVVWKPGPPATQIARAILQLLRASGVPADAVRLLTGDHSTARELAAGEDVDAVTFTGSAPGGCALQEICARRLVPLQAELNGNNAAIVWEDADWPRAAAQIAGGAFGFAGQRCTANRRAIVPGARFEAFLRELQEAAERLVWGDPLEPGTDIGPVISAARRDEVAALVARARVEGSAHCLVRLQEIHAREPWVRDGAYAQPVIAGCDVPGHPLVQEESMSPLLVVQRADDFDQALHLCNGVRQGLAAALFSSSRPLQERFLAEARAGILKLNSATTGVDTTLPFGGWKASGLGPPEHGEADRLFYTRLQAVYGASEALSANGDAGGLR
jgi:alpha-ketoglutaric semialdehyde dehydrogenase